MSDLLVVAPDRQWKTVLEAVLDRPEALGIPRIKADVKVLMGDSTVRTQGVEFAAALARFHRCCLLILDHEGSGDPRPPELIEEELRQGLAHHWREQAGALVVAPELEAWLWRARSHIATELGWTPGTVSMHLLENGFTSSAEEKPARPKEAFESVLRATNTVRSAAIYKKLAAKASLRPRGCGSPSYGRFIELLHRWFVA